MPLNIIILLFDFIILDMIINKMLKEDRKRKLRRFLENQSLNIKNLELLNLAFTHSSYGKANSNMNKNNERLEFFGDAVLKLFISEYLMSKYNNYTEGQLSKLRAYLVSEKILFDVATDLDLSKYILIGKSENRNLPQSIIADSLEALLAVIYCECNAEYTNKFILNKWIKYIDTADRSSEFENYKAILQEYLQDKKNNLGLPDYKTISESGPDHNKRFEVAVYLKNKELARGTGKTIKEASQHAAKCAVLKLKHVR